MIAVSLLFRYSDFVVQAGGQELELGLIVGLGTVGAIAVRVIQGIGIDRIGAHKIWLASLACYGSSIFIHLSIDSVHSPWVYLARVLMQSGLAGTFGAQLVFISLRVSPLRVTEVIGMHGTSGFLGMATGPFIGDAIFSSEASAHSHVQQMFLTAGCASIAALISAGLAGWIGKPPARRPASRRPPLLAVIRRYHPGWLLLMGGVMGMGLSLPGVFVRPYAASLAIDQIRWFFIAYNVIAFSVRVTTRRLPERLGERKMILLGVGCLALSMPSYLVVHDSWQLVIPAFANGLAHAFLFPAVVASAGFHFPSRYRGVATTLILGMFDLGNLIGQPMIGGIITAARQVGLPPYTTMFLTVACIFATAGVIFARIAPKAAIHKREGRG